MSAEFGITCSLWNFAADSGEWLERVAGEVGLDHVTVPAVTGAQRQFRLSCQPAAPHFASEGGWHFPPNTKAYSTAGLRPPKARWFAAADHFARLRERIEKLGLRLAARLDLRRVPALIEHERHLSQRNAWGQEVPAAGACIVNADVRELLRATIADLRRYRPARCELVNWLPDHAVHHATWPAPGWQTPVRRLLDICFCPSCRQAAARADIDPDDAARSVRVQVERRLAAPQPDAEDDQLVEAYVAARASDCAQWLHKLAAADSDLAYCLVHALGNGFVYGETAPLDRLVCLPAELEDQRGQCDILTHPEIAQSRGLLLGAWRPTFDEPATLVRLVSEAVRAGRQTFDFEDLEEVPPDAITWLKQAVRFARRG